nr:hypothetical protein HK105_001073 [Polyrhizophydium stewartii]
MISQRTPLMSPVLDPISTSMWLDPNTSMIAANSGLLVSMDMGIRVGGSAPQTPITPLPSIPPVSQIPMLSQMPPLAQVAHQHPSAQHQNIQAAAAIGAGSAHPHQQQPFLDALTSAGIQSSASATQLPGSAVSAAPVMPEHTDPPPKAKQPRQPKASKQRKSSVQGQVPTQLSIAASPSTFAGITPSHSTDVSPREALLSADATQMQDAAQDGSPVSAQPNSNEGTDATPVKKYKTVSAGMNTGKFTDEEISLFKEGHAQKYFIKLFRDNIALPRKVVESGPGYTLSGKPLDPESAAAKPYLKGRQIPLHIPNQLSDQLDPSTFVSEDAAAEAGHIPKPGVSAPSYRYIPQSSKHSSRAQSRTASGSSASTNIEGELGDNGTDPDAPGDDHDTSTTGSTVGGTPILVSTKA